MTEREIAPITCRIARAEDIPLLADFRWRLRTADAADRDPAEQSEFVADCIRFLEREHDDASLTHWLAEVGGGPVAVTSVRKVGKLPTPGKIHRHWGYVTNVYTLPAHRNRGVGSRLLDQVKLWALEEGLELLIVWPSERAYPFYGRSGFRRNEDPLVLDLRETGSGG